MFIIGVSDLERNPAVAIFDGHSPAPIAAIEENKLSRGTAANGIPVRALDYCLAQAAATRKDIRAIGIAGRPRRAWIREEQLRGHLIASSGVTGSRPASSGWRVARSVGRMQLFKEAVGEHVPIVNFEHHRCHAAGAFYTSDFDRALVLTLDGAGDMWSGLLGFGEGAEIRTLQALRFPNSFGWLYGQVTELLGFRQGADEHKTQWLGCSGEPGYLDVFRNLFRTDRQRLPVLRRRYLGEQVGESWRLSADILAQLQLRNGSPDRAAVARSVQDFLEERVVQLAEEYRLRSGAAALCVAGGVFLNGLLVRALERRTGFRSVFVQSAPGNAGTALGAGLLLRRRLTGDSLRAAISHTDLGPEYTAHAIKMVLDNCKLIYRYYHSEHELLTATTGMLNKDKIVAWYQGRMEFGNRALGHRSILASPFGQYVKENLNVYIKHRPEYHPFVLSVPTESASRYFDATHNCHFAASIGELKPGTKELDKFMFGQRRVRLHLVRANVNRRFSALLHRFGQIAAAPILVNTPFNLFGEPLVCDPRDAVRSFYCSGIDAMVIGDFIVEK